MSSKKIIQSYVYYEEKAFFVSTMDRDYSTFAGTVRGKETMVWEIDPESHERGDLLYQEDGIRDHFEICAQLIRTGKYLNPNTNG